MNIKKILVGVSAGALLLASTAMPALAAGKAAPKATGGVGYTANGLQRYAEFNAIETTNTCSAAWDVTGTWKLDFALTGGSYDPSLYDLTLAQTGSTLTGLGQYPSPGPYAYAWTAAGTISGNSITLVDTYTLGAIGTTMNMTGTIASNGTLSGTWDDNYLGGTRTGTWVSTLGNATKVFGSGCTGKGVFNYSDANGNFYQVDVQYVNVSGNETWFAGPVVSGNVGAGNWLFAKVLDGGTPGSNGDQIWGSFVTEAAAKAGVASMSAPVDGPFTITSGNLVVH